MNKTHLLTHKLGKIFYGGSLGSVFFHSSHFKGDRGETEREREYG